MLSELARRDTFSAWPHMGYRWALPENMAQAGFYHTPNAKNVDKVVCFYCDVCLLSWEPNDDPWYVTSNDTTRSLVIGQVS